MAISAHAEYRSSVPANGATIATAPAQVVITFSQETSATHSNGAATDAAGMVVSTGWSVDLNERTKMTIPLKPNSGQRHLHGELHLALRGWALRWTGPSSSRSIPRGAAAATTPRSGGGAPWGLWLAIFSATTLFVGGWSLSSCDRDRGHGRPHTPPSATTIGRDAPRERGSEETD